MATRWTLAEGFLASFPSEAARVLETQPAEDTAALLETCTAAVAGRLVAQLDIHARDALLAVVPANLMARILNSLEPGQVAGILCRLDNVVREGLLQALPPRFAGAVRRALAQAPDTAGALMDARVSIVREDLTVQDARRRVRKAARHDEDIWVVNRDGVLRGVVRVVDLFFAAGQEPLGRWIDTKVGRVGPAATRAAVAAHPIWRERTTLPVVDAAGLLLGVIPAATLHDTGPPTSGASMAGPVSAGLALGELYWITAAHLLGAFLKDSDQEGPR
ncbi:MAG TPA: CBS domain-containing protein [Candidatus Krumholzibacteria bacterium]|jgi:Mg/Co/Ni transporter MgtE